MIDLSSVSLGILLWLGCCGLLIPLLNDTSATTRQKTKIKKIDSQSKDIVIDNQDNKNKIQELNQQLESKINELALAREKIIALEEELDMTSNQLEFNQNQYIQRQRDFDKQRDSLENKLRILENKCIDLKTESDNLPQQLINNWRMESFILLQTLLSNYPTAKMMIKLKPDLPAKNLIILLKPLEKLLTQWGMESIGKPWERVAFNPQIHYSDEENLTPEELVYIRFVGYSQGNNILLPAKVNRTLPGQNIQKTRIL